MAKKTIDQVLAAMKCYLIEETGCRVKTADIKVERFFSLVVESMTKSIIRNTDKDLKANEFFLSMNKISDVLSTVGILNSKTRVLSVLKEATPNLFTTVAKGIKGKEFERVETYFSYEEFLIALQERSRLDDVEFNEEFVTEIYKDIEDPDGELITINLDSLLAYINDCKTRILNNTQSSGYIDKIKRNLNYASMIFRIACHFNGYLPHIVARSPYGRIYYKGPNLQNSPKEVRHAALGDCWEYDLEASVYAWRLGEYRKICRLLNHPEKELLKSSSYTREFVESKTSRRRALALTTFNKTDDWAINLIKRAITAIGFGAPLNVGYVAGNAKWEPSALNTIIESEKCLKSFIQDPWVIAFKQEQDHMTNTIVDYYEDEYQDKWSADNLDIYGGTQRKRLNKRAALTYLYHHAETAIMDTLRELTHDAEPRLVVHDCVYTSNRIRELHDVRYEMQQRFGEFIKLDKKQHHAWTANEQDQIDEHQQRIKEEERRAAEQFGYKEKTRAMQSRYVEDPTDTGCYDAGCVTEAREYDPDSDPFLQDMPEDERSAYLRQRNVILGIDKKQAAIPQALRDHMLGNKTKH